MTLLAAVGLMHVGHGNFHRSLDELERAGGAVGALVGAPLRAGLGPAGAVIVLVAVGALGVLAHGRHSACARSGTASHIAARFVGRHASTLLTMRDDRDPRPTTSTSDLVAAEHAGEAGVESAGTRAESPTLDELKTRKKKRKTTREDEDEEYEAEDEEYEEEEDEDDEEYEEEDDDEEGEDDEAVAASTAAEQLSIHLPPGHRLSPWKLPPATVLKRSESSKVDPQLVQEGGEVLEATMRQFGVDARLLGATVGPRSPATSSSSRRA